MLTKETKKNKSLTILLIVIVLFTVVLLLLRNVLTEALFGSQAGQTLNVPAHAAQPFPVDFKKDILSDDRFLRLVPSLGALDIGQKGKQDPFAVEP